MAKVVVLVVEDEPLVRMSTAGILEDAGLEVIEAVAAGEALKMIEAQADKITALVTDIRMPGDMDGLDLAKLVRDKWPQIRVVVTSGFSGRLISRIPEGAEFLAKPWSGERLLRAVLSTDKAGPASP